MLGGVPTARARPLLVSALLASTALCGVVVAVAYRVFVRTNTGQLVELAAMGGRGLGGGERIDGAGALLDVISVSSLAVALAVAMAIGLLRGRWRSAIAAAAMVAGATVTTELLKKQVLDRPDFGLTSSNSFPSGHTTVAASVAAAAVLVSPRRSRPYVALLGCGYAILTGLATVVAGWHRPSDALAAYAVVLGWGLLVAALVVSVSPPPRRRGSPDTGHRTVALILASAAAPVAAGAVALTVVTARRVPQPIGEFRQFAAYAGGMSSIAAAGMLTMAVWLLTVPLVDAAGQVEVLEPVPAEQGEAARHA